MLSTNTDTGSSSAASSSYAEAYEMSGNSVPPNTPVSDSTGNGLLLPYYTYHPEPHFVFPANSNSGLPPLTPITPSVEPALGFKNGYIVPQTPNPMTVPQFFQVVQVLQS